MLNFQVLFTPAITVQSISPPPTPCDPDVCHHQCAKIPFGWARSPPLSASVSPSLSLFFFLSLFYGGRDENGCLIMQRGQPIKGPRPGDLKAYSEHSWRERERGGERKNERATERDGLGFDCCMPQASSHPLTFGLISLIIVPDRLMLQTGDQ